MAIVIITKDDLSAAYLDRTIRRLRIESGDVTSAQEIGDLSEVTMVFIDLAGTNDATEEAKALRQRGFGGNIVMFGWSVAWKSTCVRKLTSHQWGCTFIETDELCQVLTSCLPSVHKPVGSMPH